MLIHTNEVELCAIVMSGLAMTDDVGNTNLMGERDTCIFILEKIHKEDKDWGSLSRPYIFLIVKMR